MPTRQLSRQHISQLLAVLAVIILIGVALYLRYVPISADTTVTSTSGTSSKQVGIIDGIDPKTGRAFGWTYDPDRTSKSIPVDFYLDGPAGIGHLIGRITANSASTDVNRAYRITGKHRFNYTLPEKAKDGTVIRDGQPHKLYVHGIDTDNSGLTNSPLNVTGKEFSLTPTQPVRTCRRIFILIVRCTTR